MTTPVLKVRDLVVEFPRSRPVLRPVRGLSFDVTAGETLCIVGESGCGKSLTSLALMDLLPRGAVRRADCIELEGRDIAHGEAGPMTRIRGKRMGMIFQEPMTALNPSMTIGVQMTEGLRFHDPDQKQGRADHRAVELLRRSGVPAAESRMKHYPHELSGGLRQRVMIAMSLMCRPALLIADEPTTALDVTIQAQIVAQLRQLQKEDGIAMLFITHDLGLVAQIADRVAVMYAGQIVETGTVAEILGTPSHPYARALIDCVPDPDLPAQKLGSIPGTVPLITAESTGCGFFNRCARGEQSSCMDDATLAGAFGATRVRCVRPTGTITESSL